MICWPTEVCCRRKSVWAPAPPHSDLTPGNIKHTEKLMRWTDEEKNKNTGFKSILRDIKEHRVKDLSELCNDVRP